jgi:hypothetical protein
MVKKTRFQRTMQALRADLPVQTKMDAWSDAKPTKKKGTVLREYF